MEVPPTTTIARASDVGAYKANYSIPDALVRGMWGGWMLAIATTLAVSFVVQTGSLVAGGLIFPAGFLIILALGTDMITGSFSVVPMAVMAGKTTMGKMLNHWVWIFIGNLIGSLIYGGIWAVFITHAFTSDGGPVAAKLIAIAHHKTTAYQDIGVAAGWTSAIFSAILCNWMVSLGGIMGLTSDNQIGKFAAMYLPIMIFFSQGFEHCIVNMFVIPTAMMLGADITMGEWWFWNEIPVTIGNALGAIVLVAATLQFTHGRARGTAQA